MGVRSVGATALQGCAGGGPGRPEGWGGAGRQSPAGRPVTDVGTGGPATDIYRYNIGTGGGAADDESWASGDGGDPGREMRPEGPVRLCASGITNTITKRRNAFIRLRPRFSTGQNMENRNRLTLKMSLYPGHGVIEISSMKRFP
eukprot:scaffold18650_cov112-Isochrysis_galbana.AAC.1